MKMLRLICASIALLANTAIAQVPFDPPININPQAPLTPLYSANHEGVTSNFYTVNPEQHAIAINLGYVNTGVLAYMEKTRQTNTKPFRRFYKGPPQNEHFYSADDNEREIVLGLGYVYEGDEGFIYTSSVPGTVPMYRVAKFNGYTGDLVHKYTLDYSEVQALLTQGWTYDDVQGYVYTTPSPKLAGGTILGLRCPEQGQCKGGYSNFRDYYFGNLSMPSTPKTGTTQRMTFILRSPDFFYNSNNYGDNGHIAFSLHGQYSYSNPITHWCNDINQTATGCLWHRGLGMFLQSDGSAKTEAWFVGGNAVRDNASGNIGALQNDRNYYVEINVHDGGSIWYTIVDMQTNAVVKSEAYNSIPLYSNPAGGTFPFALTGYDVLNATDKAYDYTVYISNFSVVWLP
jgi:hypothetical protein